MSSRADWIRFILNVGFSFAAGVVTVSVLPLPLPLPPAAAPAALPPWSLLLNQAGQLHGDLLRNLLEEKRDG